MTRKAAFTLFELLLAIALLSALVLTLLPASLHVVKSSINASERGDRLSQLAILTDVLDRGLITLVAVDAEGKTGFTFTESSIRIVTCGVALHSDELGDADDLQTIEFGHTGDRLSIKNGNGEWQLLLEHIERFEVIVFDGDSWQKESIATDSIPTAVAVSIWFGFSEEKEVLEPDISDHEDTDVGVPDWRRVFAAFDPQLSESNMAVGP
jgi:hypothetical protein